MLKPSARAGSEGFSDSEVVSLESDLLELPVPHGHYLPDEATKDRNLRSNNVTEMEEKRLIGREAAQCYCDSKVDCHLGR